MSKSRKASIAMNIVFLIAAMILLYLNVVDLNNGLDLLSITLIILSAACAKSIFKEVRETKISPEDR
ncbi:hypothetical protein H0266_15560 [Halobacillus locisalis]|uniref:Uncharacterized protein n=1 Tax=Halobacillus locisalis TaxID=220753 RepID=A0A838CWM0_9BACI|nr:hypothetical protein [Halobacillus locisalis]MBA2176313.1 hypothetical protein [Halobacillus locisalis]